VGGGGVLGGGGGGGVAASVLSGCIHSHTANFTADISKFLRFISSKYVQLQLAIDCSAVARTRENKTQRS